MDDRIKNRMESAKLAGRHLSSPTFREAFSDDPHLLINPSVVCEWETPTVEVEQMLKSSQARSEVKETLVLIRKDNELSALVASHPSIQIDEDCIPSNSVHSEIPIGHVYEALLPRKKWTITDGMLKDVKAKRQPTSNYEFSLI